MPKTLHLKYLHTPPTFFLYTRSRVTLSNTSRYDIYVSNTPNKFIYDINLQKAKFLCGNFPWLKIWQKSCHISSKIKTIVTFENIASGHTLNSDMKSFTHCYVSRRIFLVEIKPRFRMAFFRCCTFWRKLRRTEVNCLKKIRSP